MQSRLQHIQLNVRPQNLPFYRDLFAALGWNTIHADDGMLGVGGDNDLSLWFVGIVKDVANDYDGPGVNHLAIGVDSIADVDTMVDYLRGKSVAALFETPRHRPEFAGEGSTYYQVMFESPDRILLEVVYTGAV